MLYQNTLHHRGLTTMEVLLVSAIGLFLVALLLPALSEARYQARMARCTSNLRLIGRAYSLYLSDYGELADPIRLIRSIQNPDTVTCPEDHRLRREASSYVFRSLLPPEFLPAWKCESLDPHTVMALCNHHLRSVNHPHTEREVKDSKAYKLVLRANGSVGRIRADEVREILVPGERPTYANVYPGENYYRQAGR